MIKSDSSLMSESETTDESCKSKNSLTTSLDMLNLISIFQKSTLWLNDLTELHFFPFNSCNSLTIYSYKYWQEEKKILVATKEKNFKEVFFRTCDLNCLANDESNMDNTGNDNLLSARSSVSSSASNVNQLLVSQGNQYDEQNRKNSLGNSVIINDDRSTCSANDIESIYLEPVLKVHKLSKIKNEASVASLDIFDVDNFSVLAVSFVLKRKPEFYVHFYCDFETKNLDLMIECEHEFELNWMPHRVTNLKSFKIENSHQQEESFVFVNCSQKMNLLYTIDIKDRKFKLVDKSETVFVELNNDNFPDNLTSHDIKYLCSNSINSNFSDKLVDGNFDRRLTALGCQNGWIGVYFVDILKNEILKYWEEENDSFITQLKFFTLKSLNDWSKLDFEKTAINLLMLRSLEPTRIFNNVLCNEENYEWHQDLEISSSYDLVTSAVIYDATFTGYNSIALGTFGKAVLFFCPMLIKPDEVDKQATLTPQSDLNLSEQCFKSETEPLKTKQKFFYELKREIILKNSILGMTTSLLSNNGALDLVIFTLNGISIWQYDPEKVIDLANKMLEKKENLIHSDNFC